MRRLLIIFLLLVFPFQVSLAAVDPCCAYNAHAAGEQCAAELTSGQARDPVHSLSQVDAHCGLCVLGSAGYLPMHTVLPLKRMAERSRAAVAGPVHFASYLAPRPDRPQWPQPT
jgi:hypothetical protein